MAEARSVVVHGATEEVLRSATGDAYSILVAAPTEPPPPAGYPVLYMLDGRACFGTLVEMIRIRRNRPEMTAIEASIVVGIAHPEIHPYDRDRRAREYAPPPEGRGDAFLDFLVNDLHPMIERRHEADPTRRVLLGHSLAGAFVLNALAARPDAHRGYVAISPSIWAQRPHLLAGVDAMGDRFDGQADTRRLVVAVGEYDQKVAPWQRSVSDLDGLILRREERAMVDEARAYCERVRAAAGSRVDVRFEFCEGEDHASVLPVGLSRSLRFVAGVIGQGREG